MPRIVNQIIGTIAKVSRAGKSTVVDYDGTVQIYDGNWRADENLKFVLTPAADGANTALLAAAIGRRLELAGTFKQDDAPGTTVRSKSVENVIVG